MFRKTSTLGFSLIELMVVVAIIGLLAAAGLVAFTGSQQNAREARRKSDVDNITKALEQYYGANGNLYPTTTQGTAAITSYFQGSLPTDPRNTGAYVYTVDLNSTGTSFCVCAALEQLGKGNATSLPTAGSGTCNFGAVAAGAQGYHCMSNRQ